MTFLSIASLQFNAVLPALNKSREACSIEISVSKLTTGNFSNFFQEFSNMPKLTAYLEQQTVWKIKRYSADIHCVPKNVPLLFFQ